jgi:hypothetical protein
MDFRRDRTDLERPNFSLNLDDDNVTPIAADPANYSDVYSRYAMSGRLTNWDIKHNS